MKDPLKVDWYREHTNQVTVAKMSPSTYYVCSGDTGGYIRIWATNNDDKTLKLEARPVTGAVRDIAWSPDSLRVAVVGEGKESFGSVLMFDTGSNVGTFIGHSRFLLTCDHIPKRPFCVATGGEDFYVNWYKGPPFKNLDVSHQKVHTKYVNCIRFSPSGDEFVSVSGDKTGHFYESKTGKQVSSLDTQGGHGGAIYSCAWSPDGAFLLTASADKTCKVWDNSSKKVANTISFGSAIEDQQVSCLWPNKDTLISVSLNGTIHYLDAKATSPVTSLYGHNSPIYRVIYDAKTNMMYSTSSESVIIQWEYGTSKNKLVSGKVDKKTFNGISICGKEVVTTSLDGNLYFINPDKFAFEGDAIKLNGSPAEVIASADGETVLVACHNGIQILNSKKVTGFVQTKYEPTCICYFGDSQVLVGGADKKIRLYDVKKDNLVESKIFDESHHKSKITNIKVSPNGKLIASGDAGREIIVWDASDFSVKYNQLTFHTSAITDMSWSPDSTHLVSGSVDGNIIVWDFPNATRIQTLAHRHGTKAVGFINSNTVLSAGGDFRLRSWNFTFEK